MYEKIQKREKCGEIADMYVNFVLFVNHSLISCNSEVSDGIIIDPLRTSAFII